MRRLPWVLFAVVGCSAGPGAAPARQPTVVMAASASPPPPPASHPGDPRRAKSPLPAGTDFRSFTYDPCRYFDDAEARGLCREPTHAVIDRDVFASERAARNAWPRTARFELAPGYPLVVHSDQLGMADPRRGVVFVLGLFDDARRAEALQRQLGSGTRSVKLLSDEAASDNAYRNSQSDDIPAMMATRLLPGGRVTVYRGATDSTHAEDRVELPPDGADLSNHSPELHPLCTLPGGTPVVASMDRVVYGYYRWWPATCDDGQRGWVRWSDTLAHTTVARAPRDPSHYELIRLTGAECDSPYFEVRRWTAAGGLGERLAGHVGGGPC